jgi:hypothetical protein
MKKINLNKNNISMLVAFYFIYLFFIKMRNQPDKFAIAELVRGQVSSGATFKKIADFFFLHMTSPYLANLVNLVFW